MKSGRGKQKTVTGVVHKVGSPKTITVKVRRQAKHPRYGKYIRIEQRLHAHDEKGEARPGDVVRLVECRPMSKTKHWRVVEVLERAAMA